jgi:DNA-binding MarR family transcriptional regulator
MSDAEAARLRKQDRALYRRMQREAPTVEGLSSTGLQILVTVERSPVPMSPTELAEELSMTTSNVAAGLRVLYAQALVSRHGDPLDGRRALLVLTDLGKKVVTEARRGHYAWLQTAMEDVLTGEERRLLLRAGDLMQRLADHRSASAGD